MPMAEVTWAPSRAPLLSLADSQEERERSRTLGSIAVLVAFGIFGGQAVADDDCLNNSVWEINVYVNEMDLDMPGVVCFSDDGQMVINSLMLPCCAGKAGKIKCKGDKPEKQKKGKLNCDEYQISIRKLKFKGDKIESGSGTISGGMTFKVTSGKRVDIPCPCP